jgi:hypothetical protein
MMIANDNMREAESSSFFSRTRPNVTIGHVPHMRMSSLANIVTLEA